MARRVSEKDLSPKEKIISDVYYNERTGFQSQARTLEAARAKDPEITLQDVKSFLEKQLVYQNKTKPEKWNSYAAKFAREEFQIDLADFGQGQRPRFGFVCVDIFTKKLAVVGIYNKTPQQTSQALDKVIKKLDIPAAVMTDEGGEWKGAFADRLKYWDIEHIQTRTHPRFVERAIRTIKERVFARLEALDKDSWIEVISSVVDQYNETQHSVTKVSPNDAELETEFVRENIEAKTKKNVSYENISVGDRVRLRRKTGLAEKGPSKAYNEKVYTVTGVSDEPSGKMYSLTEFPHKVLRHELLKVSDVQLPDLGRPVVKRRNAMQDSQRDNVMPLALRLRESMSDTGLRTMQFVTTWLRAHGADQLKRNRLKTGQFLRLFPDLFVIQGSNVRLMQGPAPVEAAKDRVERSEDARLIIDNQGRLLMR